MRAANGAATTDAKPLAAHAHAAAVGELLVNILSPCGNGIPINSATGQSIMAAATARCATEVGCKR